MKYLWVALAVRFVLCMFLTRSYDYPDQYWQGPEVAHRMVFGYGHLTWQWTMEKPIRSPLFPLLMSGFYQLLKLVGLDSTELIAYVPRIFQFLVGGAFDIVLLKLNELYNPGTQAIMVLVSLSNWYTATLMSRFLVNSTEALLTLVAFYLWNRRSEGWNDLWSRLIVILCFCMRPTSLFFWAIVWPYELLTMKTPFIGRIKFIFKNALTLLGMVALSLLVTRWWFGIWQLIEYNFLYYNVVLKWSEIYGKSGFWEYFYAYTPGALAGSIPLYLFGIWKTFKNQGWISLPGDGERKQDRSSNPTNSKLKEVLLFTGIIMLLMSISSHKESRFLLLLIPLFLVVCVRGYSSTPKLLIFGGLLVNIFLFSIHNLIGRDGAIQVLNDLRHDNSVRSVLFLTECHHTPYYSVVHKNIPMRFPDCSPVPRLQGIDENSRFFENPQQLYQELAQKFASKPSHLVVESRFISRLSIDPQYYEKVQQYRNVPPLEQLFVSGYRGLILYRLRVA